MDELINSFNLIVTQMQNSLALLGVILLIPWCIFFISACIDKRVLLLGIIPRQVRGLPGILCAPFLHANFNHLFFNSIPLFVLSAFILINGLYYYIVTTLLITILSGLALWCFAKSGLYIGASALITGYWGLLVTNAYQHTTPTTVILGALSLYYFAGIFMGIFPKDKGVSWQGHLFGLLAGFATSYLLQQYPFIVLNN